MPLTLNPERFSMRCDPGRWRTSRRFPSVSIMAASTRRHCSCCSPGNTRKRPVIWRPLKELWPAIERALGWIDGPGDPDQDGFVEYQRHSDKGLVNQGWKDLQDAVFHADGRLAEGPIALCEVQGYVYLAKRLAAECARRLGLAAAADALDGEADRLKARFEEAFWCEELGTYALALDGNKVPCRVRSSNAGQVLFSGIAHPDRARGDRRSIDGAGMLFRLGHPDNIDRSSADITLCPTITAPSGLTITP